MTVWPVKTLGEVAVVNPSEPALSEDAPFVPMDAVTAGKRDVQYTQPRGQRSGARARAGDILFARITPCLQNGKVALVQDGIARCGGSSEFIVVRAGSQVLNGYLYQWITSEHIRDEVTALMKGATGRQRLNAEDLALTELPVPPLEEQKRIVALLDAATERVSELTACYEQARTHANNLFTSALREALESNPDWPVKTLGSIFRVCSSKRVLKSEWRQTGVPFYRGREITLLSKYGFVDNELFIAEDHFSDLVQKYGVPKLGDIMITAIGTIGNSYVVKESDRFYFKDASVIWLDKHAEIMSGYVQYWIGSSKFRDQLNAGNGATVDTLTIDGLSKMQISMPPLDEQKKIVARLDAMRAKTSEMVAAYEAKLAAAKNLRQSILEAAFAGEL
jgi:type I restriction enzyme S subunit